jgi:atlastin
MMLAPENLVVKEIGGQKVKAKELLQYFKSYLEIYKGDELPEPKSMLVVSVSFLLCFNLIFICCFKFNV